MKCLVVLLALITMGSGLQGQVPANPPSCTDPTPADYGNCALWVEQGRLRRGMHAETVTRLGFFRPMQLVANVMGDSAKHYARAYERDTRTAHRWQIAGFILTVAGIAYTSSYECDPEPMFGYCTRTDDNYYLGGGALILAGTVANLISVPFTVRGNRFAAKAVFWHNARFAR